MDPSMLALNLTTAGTVSVSIIPVIALGVFTEPARRLTQEWLYRTRDVDLREAQVSALRALVGWLVGTWSSIDSHSEKKYQV